MFALAKITMPRGPMGQPHRSAASPVSPGKAGRAMLKLYGVLFGPSLVALTSVWLVLLAYGAKRLIVALS
jgi:hypothetical protein